MRITTTDGEEYHILENCPYCHLNTAWQHEAHCPMYQSLNTFFISTPIIRESYPDYVARKKREVDAHPEWGITYLS